jgi:hypothetical protein
MTNERFKKEILEPLNDTYKLLTKYKDAKTDEDFDGWVEDIKKIASKKLPYGYNEALYAVLLAAGDIISAINRGKL